MEKKKKKPHNRRKNNKEIKHFYHFSLYRWGSGTLPARRIQYSLFGTVVLSPNVISNGYNTPFVVICEPTRTKVIESHVIFVLKVSTCVAILNNNRDLTICEYQITDFH
jgi:hypothetical protein